ncbi:MAG TPA: NAD(P)/FAD-dependent oxidoreductase [Actinobacteria bacterium]|nr:NAD(P)/FAD-dependent oxidoreductase [Actinomycetota bacterium]
MDNCKNFDVIIIGAGVIGCSIARELSNYKLKTAVVDKDSYVCFGGQSKANGGIVHGGHDPNPGSLKAIFNVEGNEMYPQYCSELGVQYRTTGAFIIGFNENEIDNLKKLRERAIKNGVQNTEIIRREQILEKEPNINKKALAALSVPSCGIVDIHRLVIALAEYSSVNNVKFFFNNNVSNLLIDKKKVTGVVTDKNKLNCSIVINCAGIDAEYIMRMAGDDSFRITPRKGEYYIMDKSCNNLVTRPCFKVPTKEGKGVVVFPTINGSVIFGGNSEISKDKFDISTTKEGFKEVLSKAEEILNNNIDLKKIITGFSGIRASGITGDFFIKESDNVKGLINVAGIESPGVASAPAIAKYVLNTINEKLNMQKKDPGSIINYKISELFKNLDTDEQKKLINENKLFGRIICRCENITEGDIVSAIHSPIPAITLDALKFKTRVGFGRCQGSFDLSRTLKIISRETGIPVSQILKNNKNSNVIIDS